MTFDPVDSELLARRIVIALYCGELDSFRGLIEDALYNRSRVIAGAPDKGPVQFTTRVLTVDGKKIIKVTY